MHQTYLADAHDDARRRVLSGQPPAYVLDFDLLYRYSFDRELYPVWSNLLAYLLGLRHVTFVLGPGTQLDFERFTHQVTTATHTWSGQDRCSPEVAHQRLVAVLELPNVQSQAEAAVSHTVIDERTYSLVKASLDLSRRGASALNLSDALNWAYVVGMRGHAADLDYFPFLLTGTTLLVDDQALDPDSAVPIARSPHTAVYSEVLTRMTKTPADAIQHTVAASFRCASLANGLRGSAAYTDPSPPSAACDWESILYEPRRRANARAQLAALSVGRDDSVTYAMQCLFDNAHVTALSSMTLNAALSVARRDEAPRKVLDFIGAVHSALTCADHSPDTDFAQLWNAALVLTASRQDEVTTIELRDRARPDVCGAYLAVELHPPPRGHDDPISLIRWPLGCDASATIAAFNAALAEHDVAELELCVGTTQDVFEFAATAPITLGEIGQAIAGALNDVATLAEIALRAGLDPECESPAAPLELSWLRLHSRSFDLYADVRWPVPDDPVVGVFGLRLDDASVMRLYAATSARFIFPSWLRAALEEVVGQADSLRKAGPRSRAEPEA